MDTKNHGNKKLASEEIRGIARLFARKVKTKYKGSRVILFGSYTKDTFHSESDIDIAVILPHFDNLMEVQLDLMRIRRNIDTRIEPHPIKFEDFENDFPLAGEIKEYGWEIT